MSAHDNSAPDVRRQLRLLLANRHAPESAALFQTLLKYIHRRVQNVNRTCGNPLSHSQQEEVCAEVLLQLIQGSLASFRGKTLPELYGFVRTIADRTTWRVVRRHERERNALGGVGNEAMDRWTATVERPDANIELTPDSPLSATDQAYLLSLLEAGTKAELSRRAGVSRAAVTQRVQRIRARIDELDPHQRMAHEVWLAHAARRAVEVDPAPPA